MADTKSPRGPELGHAAGSEPGAGRLTTHVLDTSLGRPASDLGVALYRLGADGARSLVVETRTNDDGRCDKPLLSGADFLFGRYELVFSAGPYLARTAPSPVEPAFLDEVVIRFGLAEDAHYHVPLLLSPFAYSTYRGS